MQGSRAECALARSVRKLIVLYFYDFRRRFVDAMNNCYRILFRYALGRSQWPWPDWAYARSDPAHRCLMILAIDFSQFLVHLTRLKLVTVDRFRLFTGKTRWYAMVRCENKPWGLLSYLNPHKTLVLMVLIEKQLTSIKRVELWK